MKYEIDILKHKNKIVLTCSKKIAAHQARTILRNENKTYSDLIFEDGNYFIFNIEKETHKPEKKEEQKQVTRRAATVKSSTSKSPATKTRRSRRKPTKTPDNS